MFKGGKSDFWFVLTAENLMWFKDEEVGREGVGGWFLGECDGKRRWDKVRLDRDRVTDFTKPLTQTKISFIHDYIQPPYHQLIF